MVKFKFKILKKAFLTNYLLTAMCRLYGVFNFPLFIYLIRQLSGTQLTFEEIKAITQALKDFKTPRFLVFGLGNDSIFWEYTNKKGKTVFIEDNMKWYYLILKKYPHKAFLVNYGTTRNQWKKLLGNDQLLQLELPELVIKYKWDVILVDAPVGRFDNNPGRMKSIYMASKVVREGGHVFVHDCDREVEKAYCEKYLGDKKLLHISSKLRHYKC